MNAEIAAISSHMIWKRSRGCFRARQQRIAHRRFAERARRFCQRHAVAALAVRQIAHDPRVERVPEFVRQRDDVGRRAVIRHVHARRARFFESGAIRTRPLARTHGAFYPLVARIIRTKSAIAGSTLPYACAISATASSNGIGRSSIAQRRRRGAHVPWADLLAAARARHRLASPAARAAALRA